MFAEILLFIIFILMVLYKYWTWNYDYWEKKGLPHVKPTFPFGNLKDVILMRITLSQQLDIMNEQLKDFPLGGWYKFRSPAIFVKDPELIKCVLVQNFSSFHDNEIRVSPDVEPIIGLNPAFARGELWKKTRAALTPSITTSKIKSMFPIMTDVCKQFIEYLNEHDGEVLQTYDINGKYTTDVMAACVFGLQANSFVNPKSEFRTMSNKLIILNFKTSIAILLSFYWPKASEFLKMRLLRKESTDYFKAIIAQTIDYKLKNEAKRIDYLQILVNANKEALEQNKLPEYGLEEILAQSMSFFLDGYETARLVLSNTMYELSLNPEVQTKVREEIHKKGDKLEDFDFEKIQSLEYLHMVFLESLRKHSVVGSMNRICTKETVLQSGDISIKVNPGISVSIPVFSIHKDPRYYPDPEKFDPERFTEEAEASRPPYTFFPFGGGPRICPGYKFALNMNKLALIAILLQFEILPKEKNPPTPELEVLNSLFNTYKNGLEVILKKRGAH